MGKTRTRQAYAEGRHFDGEGKSKDGLYTRSRTKKPEPEKGKNGKTAAQKYAKSRLRREADETAHSVTSRTAGAATGTAHSQVRRYEDDNVGIEASHRTEEMAESGALELRRSFYSNKVQRKTDERIRSTTTKARRTADMYRRKMDEADSVANPLSRYIQKKKIRREYAAAKRMEQTERAAAAKAAEASEGPPIVRLLNKVTGTVRETMTETVQSVCSLIAKNPMAAFVVFLIILIFVLIGGTFSSCGVTMSGIGDVVMQSSFTADDADILAVEDDYVALEDDLQAKIDDIENQYSGYDEYEYDLDEIGHNPYELAAILTVLFEAYTESGVQSDIQQFFDMQYELKLVQRTETRTKTETSVDPDTGDEIEEEVEYECKILKVTLRNKGLSYVASQMGFTAEQQSRYELLLQTRGNKEYLFGDV